MPTLKTKVLESKFKTLYFDLKDSSQGRFVQIATRSNHERQSVTIDLSQLMDAIDTLIDFAHAAGIELPSEFRAANVAQIRRQHPRAYVPWTNKEIQILGQEVAEGKSLAEMATFHQRQPSAIKSRVRTLSASQ